MEQHPTLRGANEMHPSPETAFDLPMAFGYALVLCRKTEAFLQIRYGSLTKHVLELSLDIEFLALHRRKKKRAMRSVPQLGGWMPYGYLILLYALVRRLRPRLVVETGVGPGSSTSFLLRAIQRNRVGKLVSIDLPGYDLTYYPRIGKKADVHRPPGYEVGWLIHPATKNPWDLRLGDARVELPKVIREVGPIDVFLHDSLHTFEQMSFEYGVAYDALVDGGLLLSDDVNSYWSTAFVQFCEERMLPYRVLGERMGVCRVVRTNRKDALSRRSQSSSR